MNKKKAQISGLVLSSDKWWRKDFITAESADIVDMCLKGGCLIKCDGKIADRRRKGNSRVKDGNTAGKTGRGENRL